MTTQAEFFDALWSRRHSAAILVPRAVVFASGERPKCSECHQNCDRWANENSGDTAVRGWLVMNYGFERHSVVRTSNGDLIDITLDDGFAFLVHPGDQALFDWFGEQGRNQVLWPPLSDDTIQSAPTDAWSQSSF